MDSAGTKTTLRRHLLKSRRAMVTRSVNDLSRRIIERLCELKSFISANDIALYSHHLNEVKTDSLLLHSIEADKKVYYPLVAGSALQFFRVRTLKDLSKGAYGILAPNLKCRDREAPARRLDMVILPGVAFDEAGTRIGFGKGYYDRALKELEAGTVVALAYEFQVVSGFIPVEAHDVPVSVIVTEQRVIDLTGKSGS